MKKPRNLVPQEVPTAFAELLRKLQEERSPDLNLILAAARAKGWRTATLADVLGLKPAATSKRIERARNLAALPDNSTAAERTVHQLAEISERDRIGMLVPEPERVQTMMDGRRLTSQKLNELREMQSRASRVNGAMEASHPDRRISEKFSAELARLINREGFTPYYLARELGVTHRAITSRLERHGHRHPCPSVAGTPSGLYRNRKIGDPE